MPADLIDKVLEQAQASAAHSWEYGAVFEALIEYHNPELSVFHDPLLGDQIPTLNIEDIPALQYVKPFIRTDSTTLCDGNGSSADPVSLGIPALILSNVDLLYFDAATRQLHHLLHHVPRYSNGAISHREANPSLWADYVYMVPPFLAYYGVIMGDMNLIQEAVRQCELYGEVLRTEKGPWKHIVNANICDPNAKPDPGLWSTSNGWAAAGMARVLATMRKSRFSDETKDKQASLVRMIMPILDGAIAYDTDESGLLRNYIDDKTWFGEVAGTALLAATVFRMANLEVGTFGKAYTDWALQKRNIIRSCIDHEVGIVKPVVNPLNEGQRTPMDGISPEGQVFVVLLHAAWRDWEIRANGDTSQRTWVGSRPE